MTSKRLQKDGSMKTQPQFESMRSWRQDFHHHPELGFEEHRTSQIVASLLQEFGLDVAHGIGGTGVVGVLQKGNGTASIGLRADMDALPIHELNNIEHKSTKDGVMHACGHDGHTAMLLGAAQYLSQSGNFSGRVVFIFQPAEEHGQGGPAMIADGLFDRFHVDAVYGVHNMPGMPLGKAGTRAGAAMASEALFEITIMGQGGHAAMPHKGVDALVVGAEIVGALQTIVSRKLDPGLNGVVSVTDFQTDGQRNVLPGRAILTGDARALTPETNEKIENRMRQIVEGICLAHGVKGQVAYNTVFEVLVNGEAQTKNAADAAAKTLGGMSNVDVTYPPVLASEDFAQMARMRPGNFMFLGNGLEGANGRPLHSANYDFNDDLLVPGSSFWVELVEQELSTDHV